MSIPYIGSKISLISKAEIRYEGTLYTIDSAESTVTLQNVRSHGTEDRCDSCPIAPRDEVYEYIIFRGGDIKDIHVCEPPKPPPQDPAIIETSQLKPKPPTCEPQVGPHSHGYGQYSPFGGSAMNIGYNQFGRPGVAPGSQLPPPGHPPQMQQPQPHLPPHSHQHGHGHSHFQHGMAPPPQQPPVQQPSSQGSRGSTPTQGRKTPSDEQPQMVDNVDHEQHHHHQHHHPPPHHQHHQQHQGHQHRQHRNSDREREHDRERDHEQHQRQHQHDRDRDVERDDRQQRQRGGYHRPRGRGGPRGGGGGGEYRQDDRRHYAQMNRGRGRRPPPGIDRKPKEPLKFETEFDFEESNAKFDKEELEKELKQMTLNDKVVNGDNKETNSQISEEDEEDDFVGYDKTKSFFDSLSCEAIEREKGVHTRPNWREERKINSETFGVNSTKEFNRHRFGRGRGRGGWNQQGYRGRGRGRGYGGGRPQSGGRGGRRDYGYQHGYNNQQNRQNSGESQRRQPNKDRMEGNERKEVPAQ